ncbi:RNA polymerase ECF family sigma subunit [Nocardia tenerifensis]|uniref:RNA polymerase ECF family sigma subunit n=1 Tax=Nocardia tenerifensis TaxID=228006 RepID=A0A318K3C7_9NOCA|nr:RNA polymerase sigma-70 factor [Nocardia tenerifensis]PXX65579.1 RNA polymerase ECF family sigma subunit [Nocardia tenerifensis]
MSTREADLFESYRGRLEAIAYRLLGSAGDAEDIVQETFLRWHAADRSLIETPEAWLTKVLTNLCLNQLTSARMRRESYVGQWLPEPVLAGDRMLGPADTAEQRESVSLAMLTLMERLSPNERVVYVLREAFGYAHREIADILDLTEANCQQLYRRAKQHVSTDRSRVEVDAATARRVVEEFLAAALSGDTEPLVRLLTDGAVSVADGGGRLPARKIPVVGAFDIARYLRHVFQPTPAKRAFVGDDAVFYAVVANGAPALLVEVGGRVYGVIGLEPGPDGVAAIHIQVNPDKLAHITRQWSATGPHEPLDRKW